MKVQYSNNKEGNDRVKKLITKSKARRWHCPRKLRTYPTWMKGRSQEFNGIAFQTLQRMKPKMFRTMEENGVITPHILSMRSHSHTQAKHAKKDFLLKHAKVTPFWDLMQSKKSQINQPRCLLSYK